MSDKQKRRDWESDLSDHKRDKKILKPPFLQIGNMKTASWINDRLPEMLWAVLIIGNIKRDIALNAFRSIAKFVQQNKECYNITITGISNFSEDKRTAFIKTLTSFSKEIKDALRPLLLFDNLPSKKDWEKGLDKPIPDEDWQKIGQGVIKTFWHQSEEATDCRWIKLFAQILGEKLKFVRKDPKADKKSPGIDESSIEKKLRGIYEYPNYGDLRYIRPFIRAGEITPDPKDMNQENKWASEFWQFCYDNTSCMPEEAANKKIEKRKNELSEEIEKTRGHFFKETADVRNKLISHFFNTSKTTDIDPRHEGAFGLALYGLTLFIEINFYRTSSSITARLGLRALVECYIVFMYCLHNEKKEPKIWEDYRSFGVGQIKLIYTKLKKFDKQVSSMNLDELDLIANEDKSVEFTAINLGHWDNTDLRKMSEEVGLKDIYDKYYNYSSGFIHVSWGSVRESVYQTCINPLHRYHRVPTYDLPLMQSVLPDARNITNKILDCLSEAFPDFKFRIKEYKINKEQKK